LQVLLSVSYSASIMFKKKYFGRYFNLLVDNSLKIQLALNQSALKYLVCPSYRLKLSTIAL
jgi:hypothetical protein